MGTHGVAIDLGGETAPPAALEDARLMTQVCARDLQAFEELYWKYHPRLVRFINNLVQRPHILEEVLNDTMMVVWNKPESFRGESKLSTWIFAIAYRKALKALRRRDEPVDDGQAETRMSGEPWPDEQVRQQQVQRLLLNAMGQLSTDHRTVVDLTYFHEIGYREIAEIMGCPIATVKTRMFHARRHLKRILAGEVADWL